MEAKSSQEIFEEKLERFREEKARIESLKKDEIKINDASFYEEYFFLD